MAILARKENTSESSRVSSTKTEEAPLRKGVELHGAGAWATILGSSSFLCANVMCEDNGRDMFRTGAESAAALKSVALEEKRLARLERKRPAETDNNRHLLRRTLLTSPQLAGLRPYLSEIHRHYQQTEASSSSMSEQTDINARMRSILIDWLVNVHLKLKLVPETLYLTVSLIDRFIKKKQIARNKLQLVGVTAMFVACKYEEVCPPTCSDFVSISDTLYTREEILRMEGEILSSLNFQLTVPSALVFVRRFAKVAGIAKTPRSTTELLANYLVELTLQEERMLQYLPSMICASAVYLALKTRGKTSWSAALERHSTYTETDLQACVRDIHELHGKATTNPQQAVLKKYAHETYRNVSSIAPACPMQLELALRIEPPAVLQSRPRSFLKAPTRGLGEALAARRWDNAIVID